MKLDSYQHLRVPNFSVHNLRQVLADANLDWRAALARADIATDAVARPGGTIPAHKELVFQREFVRLTTGRADLWLQAARAYTTSTSSTRGMALSTAPTVAAWMDIASNSDYAPALLQINPLRTPAGLLTGVEYAYPEAPELVPFSAYRELFVTSRSLAWLHGADFPFTSIEFPLREIAPDALLYISCEVICGSDALRMWWNPETSDQELPYGNAFQHSAWVRADTHLLTSFRASGDWPASVTEAIKLAPALNRKLANAAAVMGVSPRTLQRKLESTGHDFADVRDAALFDIASGLLSNSDQSVAQISRTLGYTDPTSFSLAFKRWTGAPPSAFREASRYGAG
jgi:AraC-like DNA-binding protein